MVHTTSLPDSGPKGKGRSGRVCPACGEAPRLVVVTRLRRSPWWGTVNQYWLLGAVLHCPNNHVWRRF
jgi:hypothetical protein